jgi:hypothetical protein
MPESHPALLLTVGLKPAVPKGPQVFVLWSYNDVPYPTWADATPVVNMRAIIETAPRIVVHFFIRNLLVYGLHGLDMNQTLTY